MENRYQKFLKETLQVGLKELYDNPFVKEAAGIPRPTFEILIRAFRSGLPPDLLVSLPEHNLHNKEYLEALVGRIDFLLSPGRIDEPEETTLSNMPPLANLLPAYEEAKKLKEDLVAYQQSWQEKFARQIKEYNKDLIFGLQKQLEKDLPSLAPEKREVLVKDLARTIQDQAFPAINLSSETKEKLEKVIEQTLRHYISEIEEIKKRPEIAIQIAQRVAQEQEKATWETRSAEKAATITPPTNQVESSLRAAIILNLPIEVYQKNPQIAQEVSRRILGRLSLPFLAQQPTLEDYQRELAQEIKTIIASTEIQKFIKETGVTLSNEQQAEIASGISSEVSPTTQFFSKLPVATMAGGAAPGQPAPMPHIVAPTPGIPTIGKEEPTFSGRFGTAWVASHPTDFLFFGLSKPSLKTIPSSILGLTMDVIGIVPPAQTAMTMGYLGYDEKRLTELIGSYSLKVQTLEPGSKERAAYQSMADFLSSIQSFKQKAPAILRPFISLGGAYGKFQLFNIRLAHYTGISPFQLLELTAKYGGPGFSYGVETALKIIASRLLGAGLHASLPGLFPYDELGMEVYFKYGPKGLVKSARGFIFKKTGTIRQRLAGKFLKTAVGKTLKTLAEKLGLTALLGTLSGGASLVVQGAWYLLKKFWKWIVGALGLFLLWLITQLGAVLGILTFFGGMILGGLIGSFFGPWGTVAGIIVGPVVLGGLLAILKKSFFPAGATIGAPGLGAGGIGAVPSLTSNAIIAPVAMVGVGGAAIILSTITSSSFFLQEKSFLAPIFYADCKVTDIHKTDVITPENKNVFVAKFSSTFPDSLLTQKIDEVIAQAKAAGFNPALAVAIWGEESHFSNYGEKTEFGEVSPGWDTGCGTPELCGSSMPKDFQESFACFFGQKKDGCNNTCITKTDFKSFMECYGPAAAHPNFASNVLAFYRELVPTGSGAIACPGGTTGEYASRLLNFLRECYDHNDIMDSTSVTDNGACLRGKGASEGSVAEILRSINTYNGILQCVGFVAAVEAGTGGTLQQTSYEVARSYYENGTPGYENIPARERNVRVGDIAVWGGDSVGHMAVVVEVAKDMSWFKVAQAIGTVGLVNESTIPNFDNSLLGFLRR